MKKCLIATFLILISQLSTQAYQDCIVTSDGKFSDIKIEDNTIVNVTPLVTISNEKNTLIVHPLKEGETKVCVLKDGKNIIDFNVKVTESETIIEETKGIEVFALDTPDEIFYIDKPPVIKETGEQNG